MLALLMLSTVSPVSGNDIGSRNDSQQTDFCERKSEYHMDCRFNLLSEGISQGYTLFSPMASHTSYLINELGQESPFMDITWRATDPDYPLTC